MKSVTITRKMVEIAQGTPYDSPIQCWCCGKYADKHEIGKTWSSILADLPPGSVEAGPDACFQDVIICPNCAAEILGGKSIQELLDEALSKPY